MAELTRQARRRGKGSSEKAKSQVEDEARDTTEAEDDGDGSAKNAESNDKQTITSELKETFREAAIEVLRPVVRKATTSAAKFAVTQGPGLVKDKVAPKIQEAGGAGAVAKGVASKGGGIAGAVGSVASGIGDKLPGGKKEGKSPSGTGRGRRLPVQEYVDVGVDLETAYDQFTQFEDWPKFMHRLQSVSQEDESHVSFKTKIWGISKEFKAEIVEQRPDERIKWKVTEGVTHTGVITFHELADRLTRIEVNLDVDPDSLIEKAGRGMRHVKRAVRADLARFKAYAVMEEEESGSWRGVIEDGDVKSKRSSSSSRSRSSASRRSKSSASGRSRSGSSSSGGRKTASRSNSGGSKASSSGSRGRSSSSRSKGSSNGGGSSSGRSRTTAKARSSSNGRSSGSRSGSSRKKSGSRS